MYDISLKEDEERAIQEIQKQAKEVRKQQGQRLHIFFNLTIQRCQIPVKFLSDGNQLN